MFWKKCFKILKKNSSIIIVVADNVYFRRSRTLQLILYLLLKKRDTEDFNVFYLPKKFYVVFYACWWFLSWIYKYSIGLNWSINNQYWTFFKKKIIGHIWPLHVSNYGFQPAFWLSSVNQNQYSTLEYWLTACVSIF